MLLRFLACFCLVGVDAWSEDHVRADVELMQTLTDVLSGDQEEMTPLAAFQQIVAQGQRLRNAYGKMGRDEVGSAFSRVFSKLEIKLMLGAERHVPDEWRRWSAVGLMAMRSPHSRRYPADYHSLAEKFADPSAANRIIAWNGAGEDEPGRIIRQFIAESRERPQRTLRVDGSANAGMVVTWDWTWIPQGVGFWWTGTLPKPQQMFTSIQRPLVVYRGENRGMYGSRTAGHKRWASNGHPLETWRMVTSGSEDLRGTHQESFPRAGLLRVGWGEVQLPPDIPVPTTQEANGELVIGAPGLDGDWTEVAVLPAPLSVRPDPALSLTAASTSNGTLTVRLNGGKTPFALPKLDASTLWVLAVADGGRPTLVISQDEPTSFVVGIDGTLPPTMGKLEPGSSWETSLDLATLPPGRHRVWVGFGPVKFDFGAVTLDKDFIDQPWPIDVWQGELITGPILVERPIPVTNP